MSPLVRSWSSTQGKLVVPDEDHVKESPKLAGYLVLSVLHGVPLFIGLSEGLWIPGPMRGRRGSSGLLGGVLPSQNDPLD